MLIVHRDQEAKNMPKMIGVKEIIQGHSIVTETGIWFYSSNTDWTYEELKSKSSIDPILSSSQETLL